MQGKCQPSNQIVNAHYNLAAIKEGLIKKKRGRACLHAYCRVCFCVGDLRRCEMACSKIFDREQYMKHEVNGGYNI